MPGIRDWMGGLSRPRSRRQERVSGGRRKNSRPRGLPSEVRHPLTLAGFAVLFSALVVSVIAVDRGIEFVQILGVVLLVAVLNGLYALYLIHHRPGLLVSRGRVSLFCLLCLLVLLAARLLTAGGASPYLIPVSAATIVLSVVFGRRFALETSWLLLVYVAVILGTGRERSGAEVAGAMAVLSAGVLVALIMTGRIRTRGRIILVGFVIGLTQLAVAGSLVLIAPPQPLTGTVGSGLFWALAHGILVGFVVSGSMPLIEYLFGISTDISLLELSNIAQQTVLRRLLVAAPGTYNHSFIVGMLAEEAAEAIGVNPLLARVGGYYHDIGKMLKPEFYGENEVIPGLHHRALSPAMSTIIIKAHVKDGVELGRHHDLPRPIIDIIQQHHGTTLVEFFYNEALKRVKKGQRVEESMFRYEGPKPQTKEAGIVMLADSVEAATRSLSDPTPARVESTIRRISRKKLDDDQLDECGLTLKEVRIIEQAFIRVLAGIFHRRPRYPQILRSRGQVLPGDVPAPGAEPVEQADYYRG